MFKIAFTNVVSSAHIRWVKDAKTAAYLNVVPVKKVTRDYTGKQSIGSCAVDTSSKRAFLTCRLIRLICCSPG